MVAVVRHDESLGAALVARAHRVSIWRLYFDFAGGLLGFIVFASWRPEHWGIPASAALCFAAFGAWGASDRRLQSPNNTRAIVASLLVLRALAAAIGLGAALVLGFGSLGISMGVWTH